MIKTNETPDNNPSLTPLVGLSELLKKLLCAIGCYYDGEYHQFVINEQQQLSLCKVAKTKKEPILLIVARSHYRESARTYPIDDKKELQKLLKLELSGNSRFHIAQQSEGQSYVNQWQFDDKVPSSYITLPETLLFALACENGQVIEVNKKVPLYIGQQGKLIHSTFANAVINSTQRFMSSVGINSARNLKQIEVNQVANYFALGLKALDFSLLASFIKPFSLASISKLLPNLLIPSSLVLLLYFSMSSAYLYWNQQHLHESIAQQGQQLDELLTQQRQYDQNLARYDELQSYLLSKKTTSHVWIVLLELFDQTLITNVRISDQRFVLRGIADKGSDVLTVLSEHPFVKDAKFDRPTRNTNGKEAYIISFVLVPNIDENAVINKSTPAPILIDNSDELTSKESKL